MKRKTLLTLNALLMSVCLMVSGCQANGITGTTSTQNELAEKPEAETPVPKNTEMEEPQKETETVADETNSETQIDSTESVPEENSLTGYEYSLYSYINDGEPIIGFNIPIEYSISGHGTSKHFDSRHPYLHQFSTGSSIKNTYMFLDINSIGYEVTEDNTLVCTSDYEDYITPYTTTIEDQGEIETEFGTAKLYFGTKTQGNSATQYREIALLQIENEVIKVELSFAGKEKSYTGKIEELLPKLLTPNSENTFQIYSTELDNVEKNHLTVDDNYAHIYYQDGSHNPNPGTPKGTAVIGMNDIDGWDNFGGTFFVSGDQSKSIEISTDIADNHSLLFNLYFEDSRVWMEDIGIITDKQQIGEMETPFGTALLYYIKIESPEGKNYEHEVALLNNQDTNIVIVYTDYKRTYDGEYDGVLEGLLPSLLENS